MMTKLLLALAIVACGASSARAGLINGGFETGDFTGWSTLGLASIETASFGSGPTQGLYQALLQTGDGSAGVGTLADLQNFTGIPSQTLENLIYPGFIQDGSALKQTFSGAAGQVLSFNWNFLTNEQLASDPSFNDFAFVAIGAPTKLVDTFSQFTSSNTIFAAETGFQTFSYQLPTSGFYTLSIGVANVGDIFGNSGLLIDNAQLSAVPEPSTLGLTSLGLALLGLTWRISRGPSHRAIRRVAPARA